MRPMAAHATHVPPVTARRGLPPGPPLPMPLQTVLWVLRTERFIAAARHRYGDIFTIRLPFTSGIVQVCHPDGVRAIFAAEPNAARAGEANVVLEPLLGRHSVLLLDGPEHLRQRRLMLPAFHGERMQGYANLIESIAEGEVRHWPRGTAFALRPAMQRITLDVILRAVFGADEGKELDTLRSRIIDVLEMPTQLAMLPWFRRELGGHSPWARFLSRRDRLDVEIQALITRRRLEPVGAVPRDDILSLLMRARDEAGAALTDSELRDELLTLLVAGHETTATSLAWFFELILRHPAALQRLDRELRDGGTDYLDAAIKETMRLRPTVPVVARVLHEDLEVMGWRLPAGSAVAANILGTHLNERVYEHAHEYRPERFVGTRADVLSWLPFGGGVRRCLGASFATQEMRIVVAVVMRSVRLRHATGRAEPMRRRAVTMVPRHGARVVVESRTVA
jgi:cytochrome P450